MIAEAAGGELFQILIEFDLPGAVRRVLRQLVNGMDNVGDAAEPGCQAAYKSGF